MSTTIKLSSNELKNNFEISNSGSGEKTFSAVQKLKTAVLGASGLVGQHFVRLLADHPFFELALITASDKSAGKKFKELAWPELFSPEGQYPLAIRLSEKTGNLIFQKTDPSLITKIREEGVRLVFSALPGSLASEIESNLRNQGLAVFTNASAHRLSEDVPVIIPEVNSEHLSLINIQKEKYGGFIVAGSNCCVAGLVLSLKPLLTWGIKKVRVTTFQSISGAGFSGLRSLEILNNVIPYIKDEEDKIARETSKILGFLYNHRIIKNSLSVTASCVRVPVKYGHLLDVEVIFQNIPELEELIRQMASFPGLDDPLLPSAPRQPLIILEGKDRPQPAFDLWAGWPQSARGMAVCLGRLRIINNSFRYFALSHNLIRGAAGNCLLTAELALRLGYLN